jgi:alkanesulfonate monooxygenase SsuD/methylene tetrahydromethanopterin reductase-like flavin-dependent oxidoreductase (luciferase family)
MSNIGSRPAIGVIFHPTFPPETLAGYARRAESAGFDELWLWDDCFLPGAFTSAAIALSATQRLNVGIGLLPVKAYNPLFAAMEITTLARAFPGRFMPGFGHGVDTWMAQIGAAPKPSLKALKETVESVRHLLAGEQVTTHSDQVNLENVQMQMTPETVPALYVGAMREKSLQMAGRVGDGTILTGMSSPAYIRWAMEHIRSGMAEAGRRHHRVVVYLDVKVSSDGIAARGAARRALADRLPWADVQVRTSGIADEVDAFISKHGREAIARQMPDDWLDAFAVAGTPEHVAAAIQLWAATGVDSIVFQPLNGDPDCLDEYLRYFTPVRNLIG